MTNEEKAIQLFKDHPTNDELTRCRRLERRGFVKGAEWKEQQMIDKAVEWFKKNVTYTHPRKGTEECVVNLNAFIEAMKGE